VRLSQALRLAETPRIAFVGAGGKTSALSIVAKEVSKPVVVTTTTHLGAWQTDFAVNHFIIRQDNDLEMIEDNLSGVILITKEPQSNRLTGLNNDQTKWVYGLCERHQLPLLMECDGSRQLPIKAPGINEPPIPDFVDTVVVVAGLTGLDKPLNNESVYHPDLFSNLGNLAEGDLISNITLARVLAHKEGGLKNIPNRARRILLLNQADTPALQARAGTLAKIVQNSFAEVIVAELKQNKIHAVIEPTAAIILAAGSSSRYGQTKQILDYKGVPFVRAIARSAINAGLSPIVIVTGADAITVKDALIGLSDKIRIIYNPNWQNGQSTSIRAGIDAISGSHISQSQKGDSNHLPGNPGSAIFLLADQPQVNPAVLRCLVEEHSRTLAPVIAPLVDGRRGNPVLFDRVTFLDLRKLEGDIGGRGIFSKYPPDYIQWNDISLQQDVDTPTDYERLLID